jgi:DnaJ-domain-containing protein 1
MSIGKRLFNMARAELNSLLDRATEAERTSGTFGTSGQEADPDEDLYRRFSLDELSDAELEAEIERRYKARQAAARGGAARSEAPPPRSEARTTADRAAGAKGPGSSRARSTPADEELRRAYAALEVPFGADFATVRKSYRALMRKYHPDRHTGSPEKQKTATELAQKLTQAYELLEQKIRK